MFCWKNITNVSVSNLFQRGGELKMRKKGKDVRRPAVCFGAWEGKVEQSQTGDGGLHAVGQSPGAAVP